MKNVRVKRTENQTYLNGDRVVEHSRMLCDNYQLVRTESDNDYNDRIYIWNLKTDNYTFLEAVIHGIYSRINILANIMDNKKDRTL